MQKYWNTVQDEHGNPRYGASVAVQQSGVNSTIYSDSSGLVPKTNPLTTDATRGYFEFYAASGAYDLVVTGVGFASYTITNGAEVGLPATDVTVIQSGTGAVAEPLQTVIRYLGKSVKSFGAVGDGVTDDTTAINNAIAAAVAGAYPYVLLPAATYAVTQINLSPFVTLVPLGEVWFKSSAASGKTIHVSTQYGDRITPSLSPQRGQAIVSGGSLNILNTNGSNAATGIYFGDVYPSTTYNCHSIQLHGVNVIGYANSCQYDQNAYDISWFGGTWDGTGTGRTGRGLLVPTNAAASANSLSFYGLRRRNLAEVIKLQAATMAMDLSFFGGSDEANLQIVANSSSTKAVINFHGNHHEINEYAPYSSVPMFHVNGSSVNFVNPIFYIGDAAGSYSNPVVSSVITGGRVNVDGAKYVMNTASMTLHACDGTSFITLDETPDQTHAATYLSLTAGGVRRVNGLREMPDSAFTPTVTFGGGSTGLTYTSRLGNYSRSGKRVFFSAAITLSAKGSSTGAVKIGGLPFTRAGTNGTPWSVSIGYFDTMAGLTSTPFGVVTYGATTVELYHSGAASAAALAETNFNNTTTIQVSGFYITDDA